MQVECAICGVTGKNRLQQHHIVPRRYGGSDTEENLVTLCAGCHQALEKIYDDRFFERLQRRRNTVNRECAGRECSNTATQRLRDPRPEEPDKRPVCDQHGGCLGGDLWLDGRCEKGPEYIVPAWSEYGHRFLCETHAVCGREGCRADDVFYLNTDESGVIYRCYDHADEHDLPYYWD